MSTVPPMTTIPPTKIAHPWEPYFKKQPKYNVHLVQLTFNTGTKVACWMTTYTYEGSKVTWRECAEQCNFKPTSELLNRDVCLVGQVMQFESITESFTVMTVDGVEGSLPND